MRDRGRRTETAQAGTRGAQALRYGDLRILEERFRRRSDCATRFSGAGGRGSRSASAAIVPHDVDGQHCHRCGQGIGDQRGCMTNRWLKCHGSGGRLRFIVRDHDTVVPVSRCDDGGARARAARWKISMMTIRPPQQGHGRGRCGNGVSLSTGGAGTASSSRARATLALRPALARRP